MKTLGAAIIAAISLGLSLPAFAHHSAAAEFDVNRSFDLSGVITKVEWTNPHAHLYIEVKDSKGNLEEWAIEMDHPDFLSRSGWTSTTVKPGDLVICTGGPAKSGARAMRCTTVQLANGEKLRS